MERLNIDEAIMHAREVAEKNKANCERNTIVIPNRWISDTQCAEEHEQLAEWLEELKHYKDLEEQGRLKGLPFKIGDTVYTNFSMQGWYMQKKKRPYEAKIVFIGINGIDDIFNVELGEGKMLGFSFSDIGKTVFLTKEEAEAKLKEMRGAEWMKRKK